MSTFREKIEEINLRYLTLCKCRDDYSPAMVEPELTEVVCAEVSKLAAGLPKVETYGQLGRCAVERQLAECQAFIKEQTK